ncbi:MAG: PspA/IM30 family protein [Spirochaetota bacterium]
MGIFSRLRRLIQSNINDMISRAENPEKMLNQLITDMNKQLIESKRSVAAAIADEKKLERQIRDNRAKAEEWETRARLALKSGDDNLAKEALVRKQEIESYVVEYEKQLAQQHESVEKLKSGLRGLQQKLEEAQRKKNLLIARAKRAETQKRLQETMSGMSDTSAFEAFDRMSARMDDLEAQNEALEELENTRDDHSLEEKFRRLEGGESDGDKLLEEFKQRMSIEDARPDSLEELKRRMQEEEKEEEKEDGEPKDR